MLQFWQVSAGHIAKIDTQCQKLSTTKFVANFSEQDYVM